MAIDVGALAQQILGGMKGALGPLSTDSLNVAAQEATQLAQSLADISAARSGSGITDKQAKDLIAAQMSSSAAALQAQMGVADLAAKTAVKKGLGILGDVGLTAMGLGWAAPLLNDAITGL